MCDESDLTIGAVLGQREEGKPYVVYYASKTLNEEQRNYTTTEKELLAVFYDLDEFCVYLVRADIIIFTDHSTLKYLLTKQNSKAKELLDGFSCYKSSTCRLGTKMAWRMLLRIISRD